MTEDHRMCWNGSDDDDGVIGCDEEVNLLEP